MVPEGHPGVLEEVVVVLGAVAPLLGEQVGEHGNAGAGGDNRGRRCQGVGAGKVSGERVAARVPPGRRRTKVKGMVAPRPGPGKGDRFPYPDPARRTSSMGPDPRLTDLLPLLPAGDDRAGPGRLRPLFRPSRPPGRPPPQSAARRPGGPRGRGPVRVPHLLPPRGRRRVPARRVGPALAAPGQDHRPEGPCQGPVSHGRPADAGANGSRPTGSTRPPGPGPDEAVVLVDQIDALLLAACRRCTPRCSGSASRGGP